MRTVTVNKDEFFKFRAQYEPSEMLINAINMFINRLTTIVPNVKFQIQPTDRDVYIRVFHPTATIQAFVWEEDGEPVGFIVGS